MQSPPANTATTRLSFLDLYTPKLVTVLREGYSLDFLRGDAISGLTVAIVALPLSMAIAISSGVTPDRGLYAAIVGGFIVSALGGSRFQIGGPAGAFIGLVAATVHAHGVDGLLLATLISGLMLVAIGYLRLGTFIKYIPYPVTVGFTAGIAVIIFLSQIKDLLGLTLAGPEPGDAIPKIVALTEALSTSNVAAIGIAVLTIAIIVILRKVRPKWPSYLIAVVAGAVIAAVLGLPVETIGTRFGGIPRSLPLPQLPPLSLDKIIAVLPSAVSFTLLGSIESLLSAVVADSMSGRHHRSNCELVAQGLANIGSALIGGICVTGTIARTATNVRAGAHGPVSGMLHSAFLLVFMLVAAPAASYLPLASLAGVLAVVAWYMAEKHEFATLIRASRGDALVLLTTFLLVVFRDLAEGILVGFALGALLFLRRMAESVAVEQGGTDWDSDRPDRLEAVTDAETRANADPDVIVCRISGAFFFGAASNVAAALERIGEMPKAYVFDMAQLSLLDSTGAVTIASFVNKAAAHGIRVFVSGANPSVRRALLIHHVRPPQAHFRSSVADAIAAARRNEAPAAEPAGVHP